MDMEWVWTGVAMVFIVPGSFVFGKYFMVGSGMQNKLQDKQMVRGKIVKNNSHLVVDKNKYKLGDYEDFFAYEYEIDGESYRGDILAFMPSSFIFNFAFRLFFSKFLKLYEEGSDVVVFIDPTDHSESTIDITCVIFYLLLDKFLLSAVLFFIGYTTLFLSIFLNAEPYSKI